MAYNEQKLLDELQALSEEKLYLGAIRSLLEDYRFQRYFTKLKLRYEATDSQIDVIAADDSLMIATLKGSRLAYKHEIQLIESASDRIIVIDELLTKINKQRKVKQKGNEGLSNITPPKEK